MAIGLRQAVGSPGGNTGTNTASEALTFTNPSNTGNAIIMMIMATASSTATPTVSVSDNKGQTYSNVQATFITDSGSSKMVTAIFWVLNCVSGVTTTTATISSAGTLAFIMHAAGEYVNIGSVDTNKTATGTGGTTFSTASITPATSGELFVAVLGLIHGTTFPTTAATSPLVSLTGGGSNFADGSLRGSYRVAEFIQTGTPTAVTPTFTQTGGTVSVSSVTAVAFKPRIQTNFNSLTMLGCGT